MAILRQEQFTNKILQADSKQQIPVDVYGDVVRPLDRERWAVEQMPLAAEQILGCERAFVFSEQSR